MDKQKDFEKGWEDYKKKRKQQTEEMIGIIQKSVGGCARHWASLIAEELIKYYQPKIHEGVVVLTREEYDELQIGKDFNYGYHCGEDNMTLYYENIRLPEVRKETAEKFAEMLKEKAENKYLGSYMDLSSPEYIEKEDFLQIIDEIAKEITEGSNG